MKNPIKIGEQTFKYKKDALTFYKSILNTYDFAESLSDEDFNSVIDLLFYNTESEDGEQILDEGQKFDLYVESNLTVKPSNQNEETTEQIDILDIKVSKVQFNTKCFEVFYRDSTSQYISYILLINKPKENHHGIFNAACRSIIQRDLIDVKQLYFKYHAMNGFVKCQESGQLCKWGDLAVDHRQPNTFSVIVDRFKEVFQIDVTTVDYEVNKLNILLFKDETLIKNFKNYHKDKANLRIVKKELNLGRTGMARIKRTSKDLTIK